MRTIVSKLQAQRKRPASKQRVLDRLFEAQRKMVDHPARRKVICCSRQAGKTEAMATVIADEAILKPYSSQVYITHTQTNAQGIMWRKLLDINRTYGLVAHADSHRLVMTYDNGSVVQLASANEAHKVEHLRGFTNLRAMIDEAQSFKPHLKYLVEEILKPTLYKENGELWLIGTPPRFKGTYFERCFHGEEGPGWEPFRWLITDNPHMPDAYGDAPRCVVELYRKTGSTRVFTWSEYEAFSKGVTIDDPAIRRDIFGEFVPSQDDLVYGAVPDERVRDAPRGGNWQYVVGIDVGLRQPTAFVVLGWREHEQQVWVLEEIGGEKGMAPHQVCEQFAKLRDHYPGIRAVVDSGGMGVTYMDMMQQRFGMFATKAEKTEKMTYVELMRADLVRDNIVFTPATPRVKAEVSHLGWDEKKNDRFDRSCVQHRHDALLYGWRHVYAYLERGRVIPDVLVPGSREFNERREREAFAAIKREHDASFRNDDRTGLYERFT